MQFFLQFPDKKQLEALWKAAKEKSFTYTEVGATRNESVPGYDNDCRKIKLGDDPVIWERAKIIINHWQQFPPSWTKIYPETTALQTNNHVIMLFKLFGIWWTNPTRIVYTIDEPDRYGFAYGTLLGHVEQGEEFFWIERKTNGTIYYHIKAFSKPYFWGAKLIYPLARLFQKRFVLNSLERMKMLVQRPIEQLEEQAALDD